MKFSKKELAYAKENFNEVKHTTLNPEGPGVVRIHLIPPKVTDEEIGASAAIINGQDIIPVDVSWTILLSEFISEVNTYSGREIGEAETGQIMKNLCRRMRKIYPFLSKKIIISDIQTIMTTFKQIAYREEVSEDVPYMNIAEYAPFMRAPHRMDLMVSSMKKDEKWHCNLKCLHCYASGQLLSEESELSTAQWKKIIDTLKDIGIPQITFTGGEPTMREDLIELIDHGQWFVTRLNTNGIKLTTDYCRALQKASLDSLQITLYSEKRDIHNRLVGADGFEKTTQGIKNALEAGLSVSINTPLCTENADYLSTLEYLHGLGVTYVTCSGLITTGNAAGDESVLLQLDKERISGILREAVSFCNENGMEINFTSPGWVDSALCDELNISIPNCGACLSNMAITPGGNVVPCQSWLSGKPLGNILQDSWEAIWNSADCLKRREYSVKMTGFCPLRITGN